MLMVSIGTSSNAAQEKRSPQQKLCHSESNMDARKWVQEVQLRCNTTYDPQDKKHSPIYRLPESLKSYSNCSYDPKIVKLGLFNQDFLKLPLSQIEEKKVEAVHKTVNRLKRKAKTLADLAGEISKLDIRQYYDEEATTKCDEDVLVWRFIMDGCFILEFFNPRNFGVFFSFQRSDIFYDIFKLENQIPLVVLVKILELWYRTHEEAVERLARMLFEYPPFQDVPFSLKSESHDVKKEIDTAHHLLDLVHRMVVRFLIPVPVPCTLSLPEDLNLDTHSRSFVSVETPSLPEDLDEDTHSLSPVDVPFALPEDLDEDTRSCSPDSVPCVLSLPEESPPGSFYSTVVPPSEDLDEDSESDSEYHLQSAENLQKHGIKFKPSEKGKVKFQERLFRQSILFLPKIYVDHDTEALIRNLMAFDCEKRSEKREEKAIICQLMILMDCLIETRNDVAILRKERILVCRIGSDEDLAVMFNNLCKGTPDCFSYYKEEVRKVKEYCNKKLNKDQWINWYREYLSKPWHMISLAAAAMILTLTAIQTYYTAIQTYYTEEAFYKGHP